MDEMEKEIFAGLEPPLVTSTYGPENLGSRPTHIIVIPDYGDAYAWDEDHGAIVIAKWFPDHPSIEEITAIENHLESLASWLWEADELGDKFPWEELHQKAQALAERLADLLRDTGVQVEYQRHRSDPVMKQRNKC